MTVFKLAEGRGLIEAGIKVFEDIDWYDQGAATTRTHCEDAFCYQDILKEKEKPSSLLTSATRASPPVLFVMGGVDRDDPPTV